jgi:hypothetical protein
MMEVLGFIVTAAIVLFIGFWAVLIGGAALFLLWMIWPFVLGVVGGVALWWNGYDNVGIIFAIVCFIGQFGLWQFVDDGSGGSSYNPMSSKRAHYNKDGKLTGYSDKD